MKEVKLNGNTKEQMPRPVYNQCLWIVRDYKRLIEMDKYIRENIPDGEHSFVYYADSSEGLLKKEVLENARFQIKCVEESFSVIPEEFRKGIYENIAEKVPFDFDTSINTWKKWKSRFIKQLAQKLNLY